jgi:hypothetical protein
MCCCRPAHALARCFPTNRRRTVGGTWSWFRVVSNEPTQRTPRARPASPGQAADTPVATVTEAHRPQRPKQPASTQPARPRAQTGDLSVQLSRVRRRPRGRPGLNRIHGRHQPAQSCGGRLRDQPHQLLQLSRSLAGPQRKAELRDRGQRIGGRFRLQLHVKRTLDTCKHAIRPIGDLSRCLDHRVRRPGCDFGRRRSRCAPSPALAAGLHSADQVL